MSLYDFFPWQLDRFARSETLSTDFTHRLIFWFDLIYSYLAYGASYTYGTRTKEKKQKISFLAQYLILMGA